MKTLLKTSLFVLLLLIIVTIGKIAFDSIRYQQRSQSAVIPLEDLEQLTDKFNRKYNGTKSTLLDYKEIYENIELLKKDTKYQEEHIDLITYSIELEEGYARKQLEEIKKVYPDSYIEECKQLFTIKFPMNDSRIISKLKGRGSVAIQITYQGEPLKDNLEIAYRDTIVRTIFDVGRICPPVCPKKPGGGQE